MLLLFIGIRLECGDNQINEPIPFLNIDGQWADSTLKLLSPAEILAQHLVIYDQKSSPEFNLYGGFSRTEDSLFKYKQKARSKEFLTEPLRFFDSNEYLDFGLNAIPSFPDLFHLCGASDDSLHQDLAKLKISQIKAAGTNFGFVPTISENLFSEKLIQDTFFNNHYHNLQQQYLNRIKDINALPTLEIPLSIFSDDKIDLYDSLLIEFHKQIINQGVAAVYLDSIPTGFSGPDGIKGIFQTYFNFKGLIICNARGVGLSDLSTPLISGIDLFLSNAVDFNEVEKLSKKLFLRKSSKDKLLQSTKKILLAKEWLMSIPKERGKKNIANTSNSIKVAQLRKRAYKNSIILLRSRSLPLAQIGNTKLNFFIPKSLAKLEPNRHASKYLTGSVTEVSDYNDISINKGINIILIDNRQEEGNYKEVEKIFADNSNKDNTILMVFGEEIVNISNDVSNLIYSPITDEYSCKLMISAIFGSQKMEGRTSLQGEGIVNKAVDRLYYGTPEESGLSLKKLSAIDSIVNEAITNGAFPGCQVFVAYKGNVVYNKSFGHHTYDEERAVKNSDLYDLASVTKIASTTLAFMKMYQDGKIDLDDKLGKYFKAKIVDYKEIPPDTIEFTDTLRFASDNENATKKLRKYFSYKKLNDTTWFVKGYRITKADKKTNIFNIPFRQLLTHRSGLAPSLPVYQYLSFYDRKTRTNRYKEFFSTKKLKDSADILLAEDLFLYNRIFDSIWLDTRRMPVSSLPKYVYSDANMVLTQLAIDSINGYKIDRYTNRYIYKPLNLQTTCFNPLNRFNKSRIAPTSDDKRWRKQLLQGYVHDPTAAMFGGVAGNAGLFSNAHDLGIIGQMLLQKGIYGGVRLYHDSIVDIFTSKQNNTGRGLGFAVKSGASSLVAPSASKLTYGHTGFTGTCIWIDPENEIVFVFLSNRVHPNERNSKIAIFQIRQKVHEAVYQSIEN